MNTHWEMPDRHIRAVEAGDTFDFEGRAREVRDVKRNRQGDKTLVFQDGYQVTTSGPRYDDVTVDLLRPRAKFLDRSAR